MNKSEIEERLRSEDINVTNSAIDQIDGLTNSEQFVDHIVANIEDKESRLNTKELIDYYATFDPSVYTDPDPVYDWIENFEKPESQYIDRDVSVSQDITGQSDTNGDYEFVVKLFKSRFQNSSSILKQRININPLSAVREGFKDGDEVETGGLIKEIGETQSGNPKITLEDISTTFKVVFWEEDDVEKVRRLVENQFIGVRGTLKKDGDRSGIILGEELYEPEIPSGNMHNTTSDDVYAAFVSDIHIGAKTFASEKWRECLRWLNSNEHIEYLFIAGDIIEGIGVYPGQEEDLEVKDMYEQYRLFGETINKLRDSLTIVVGTGNHDMIRLAEPQPALPEKYIETWDNENVYFVGNPAQITIESGPTILMYHGMSINGFADSIPDVTAKNPETAQVEMLKKRHLAPMYGKKTPIAPEEDDYLVISDIPDVLHCGHVHTVGTERYNNVLTMNTGAWQYQTDYQKKRNIVPEVGRMPVVNFKDYSVSMKQF